MKIRWTGDSLRLRITPTELETLRQGLPVAVTLRLPGASCGWAVTLTPEDTTSLSFCRGDAFLTLSPTDLACLLVSDAEGVYFRTEGLAPVRYFVEKDFPCVHPGAPEAEETPVETFAPPVGFKVRHGGCG